MLCELAYPPTSCDELTAYIQSLIDLAVAKSGIRYGEGTASASSDDLDDLWLPCTPPDCAIGVWYNTVSATFEVWGLVSGTWRQTGTASRNGPYYTEFEGIGGPVQEGWSGGWRLDGDGNIYPKLTLGSELLTNEDFEEWTGGNLDDWSVTGTDTEEYTVVKNGLVSAHITRVAATATVEQAVTNTVPRWYLTSMWGYNNYSSTFLRLNATNDIKTYIQELDVAVWRKLSLATFITTSPFTTQMTMLGALGFDPDFYVDTASVKHITEGWCLYKDFYSNYGTCYVDVTLNTASDVMGLLFNYLDDDNYCMVIIDQTNAYVYEVDTGTATLLNSYAIAYVAGARLEVLRDSLDQLTIDYNGANVVTGLALVTPVSSAIHGIVSPDELSFASAFGYTPE